MNKRLTKKDIKKLAYLILMGSFNHEVESTCSVLQDIFHIDITFDEADEITNAAADMIDKMRPKTEGWEEIRDKLS